MKFPLIIWAAETSAAGLKIGATAGLEQKYWKAGCDLYLSFHTVSVRTCCSPSIERLTHAAGVLGHHFNIVGGSRLQVVQSVRAHVAHKEVHGLACGAWNTTAQRVTGVHQIQLPGHQFKFKLIQNNPHSKASY